MTTIPEFVGDVILRPGFTPRPEISHVLFDFDGTLSLIRQGWPDVMVPMFTEALPPVNGETEADRRKSAFEDIMRLNGKQTIYQMIQLAERVRERGGVPEEPLTYKHEYLRRLDDRIGRRLESLRTGACPAEDYLVHGATALLEVLRERGLTLYLASGTDLPFVKREAELLGLNGYFGPHIYGRRMTTRPFPRRWSSSESFAKMPSTASSSFRSATVTSRSRTPRMPVVWRSPWRATRRTTDRAGWTSGSVTVSWVWEPTSSSLTIATPASCWS